MIWSSSFLSKFSLSSCQGALELALEDDGRFFVEVAQADSFKCQCGVACLSDFHEFSQRVEEYFGAQGLGEAENARRDGGNRHRFAIEVVSFLKRVEDSVHKKFNIVVGGFAVVPDWPDRVDHVPALQLARSCHGHLPSRNLAVLLDILLRLLSEARSCRIGDGASDPSSMH